jgi:hypothetical protein
VTRSSRLFLAFCCLGTSGSFVVAQNAAPEQEVSTCTTPNGGTGSASGKSLCSRDPGDWASCYGVHVSEAAVYVAPSAVACFRTSKTRQEICSRRTSSGSLHILPITC